MHAIEPVTDGPEAGELLTECCATKHIERGQRELGDPLADFLRKDAGDCKKAEHAAIKRRGAFAGSEHGNEEQGQEPIDVRDAGHAGHATGDEDERDGKAEPAPFPSA
ncbi:MAG: hypothetical protein ACK55I_20745, partial [bacterium]